MSTDRLTTEKFWNLYWEQPGTALRHFVGYDERVWRAIFSRTFAGAKPGQTCIEIGCGDSRLLPWIAHQYGLGVAGVDFSEIGCRLARERLQQAGIEGQIWQRDIFEPNSDLQGRFDYVMSFGLVEHFDDPTKILKVMRRLLKPTGHILTTTPNVTPHALNVWLQRRIDPEILALHKLMSADQLRRLHEQSGFQTIESGYEGMGLSLACDRPNWRRKTLQTISYRTVQVLRRGFELLRLQPPRCSFTGLFIVYRGKVQPE